MGRGRPTDEKRISTWKRKFAFPIWIIALIIFIPITIVNYRSDIILDFNSYIFEIDVIPTAANIILSDFNIFYNFVNEEGKISFRISGTNKLDNLYIRFPNSTEVANVSWTNKSFEEDIRFKTYKNGIDYFQEISNDPYKLSVVFILENTDKNNKSSNSMFELKFKGKIFPNARFDFIPSGGIFFPLFGTNNGAFFKFYIGERYQCLAKNCYWVWNEENIKIYEQENLVIVATKREPTSWQKIGHSQFILNYNKEYNKFLSSITGVLKTILLLGSIPSLEYIYYYFVIHKKIIGRRRKKKQKSTNNKYNYYPYYNK